MIRAQLKNRCRNLTPLYRKQIRFDMLQLTLQGLTWRTDAPVLRY